VTAGTSVSAPLASEVYDPHPHGELVGFGLQLTLSPGLAG
jgi:hypothetical protein